MSYLELFLVVRRLQPQRVLLCLLWLFLIINCIEAQVWSEEDCALSVCECLPSLKLINCRNRGLYELDLENLPAAYFANVRILDLRANKLRDLPASNLVHYVFPDLKIIQLADNIHLSCSQINN